MTEMRTSVDIATDPPSPRSSRPRVVFVVDHNLGALDEFSPHLPPVQQPACPQGEQLARSRALGADGRTRRLLFLGER
jgi:hypothetical protein